MSGSLVGPGRYAASLSLAMTPGGGAVVRFLDLRDGTAPPLRTASTMLAQRTTLGGPWSAARLVDAVSVDSSIDDITMARMDPVLAGDGTAVMLLPAPYAAGGGTVALGASTTWRTGWETAFTEQPTLPARPYTQMTTGMVLDPAGRATLTYIDDTTFGLVAATTALPKPFVRTRAALSSASPRVGVAVTCKSAWTGGKTLAFRWLRGGSAIAGATSKTYVPKAADRDRGLSCRVTATNPTGSTVTTSVARTVGG